MSDSGPARPPSQILDLSSDDIIKIQSATFLTLCAAFHGSRLFSMENMAAFLLSHVQEGDQSPGAQVILAFAALLARAEAREAAPGRSDERPPRPLSSDPSPQPPFTVVEGGRLLEERSKA